MMDRRNQARLAALTSSVAILGISGATAANAAAPSPQLQLPPPVSQVVTTVLSTVHQVIAPTPTGPTGPTKPVTSGKPTPPKATTPKPVLAHPGPVIVGHHNSVSAPHAAVKAAAQATIVVREPAAGKAAATAIAIRHLLRPAAHLAPHHAADSIQAAGKPSLLKPVSLLPAGPANRSLQDELLVVATLLASGLALSHLVVRRRG